MIPFITYEPDTDDDQPHYNQQQTMATRPTHQECTGKLRQALQALGEGLYLIIEEDRHFIPDMNDLGSRDAQDHWNKVYAFLQEIQAAGGADCYVGRHPPDRSYHEKYKDVELFAFAWESESARRKMYLKFGIKLNKQSKTKTSKKTRKPVFLYLNCHEDAPEKKDR